MANIKKGAVANLVFPMVDKTDFASIESGITASDFNSATTKKFFGVNHTAASAFVSGSISKATTLVRSGIFQQELKTTETNYDFMLYQFKHPSCADQLLVFQTVTYDDSDMYSYMSDLNSNIISMVSDLISLASDTWSLVSDVDSQLTLNYNLISDTWSLVSDVDSQVVLNAAALTTNYNLISDVWSLVSDVDSQVVLNAASIVAAGTLTSDAMSDIGVAVWLNSTGSNVSSRVSDLVSLASDTWSLVSDVDSQVNLLVTSDYISKLHSDLYSAIGGFALSSDAMSDIAVEVWLQGDSAFPPLGASNISDIASRVWAHATVDTLATSDYLSKLHSDLYSALGNVSAVIGYSDISDIASAVWADPLGSQIVSDISDIRSAIEAGVIVNTSSISDIVSAAEVMIETAIIPLGASNISDVASRVWAHAAAGDSDYLSKIHSDIISAIGNVSVVLTASDISDIASAVTAAGVSINASDMSDIASRVWATNEGSDIISRISDLVSMVSDTYSLVSDVDSQVVLNAAALTTNYNLVSDVHSLTSDLGSNTISMLSDMWSLLSDVESAIDGLNDPTASGVASAIWGEKYNTHSAVASSFGSFVTQQTQGASNMLSNISGLVSDAHSDLRSYLVGMSGALSDVESQVDLLTTSDYLSKVHSDLASAVGAVTVTLTSDAMSDIAVEVWGHATGVNVDNRVSALVSSVSDVDSQVLLNASMISDIDSQITLNTATLSDLVSQVSDVESQVDLLATSDYLSKVHSDIASAVGGITTALTSDTMSDIAVAVWADATGVNVDNRVSALVSQVSDVDSQLLLNASMISDVDSQITLNTATLSTLASTVSDIDSQLTENYSLISDIDSQLTLTVSQLSDVESAVDAIFTTALTESYNVDGAAPTAAQALFYLMQTLAEFSISGTTLTVKKLDGSTGAMTFTLNDATNPTSITRAT